MNTEPNRFVYIYTKLEIFTSFKSDLRFPSPPTTKNPPPFQLFNLQATSICFRCRGATQVRSSRYCLYLHRADGYARVWLKPTLLRTRYFEEETQKECAVVRKRWFRVGFLGPGTTILTLICLGVK
ncbi:hypothetical protein ACJW30_04G171800 [Castanea mollissima]